MKQVWLTDCMSVYQSLTRPTLAKMSDKRLSIEIASLRQSLWRRPGEKQGDDRTLDDIPTDTTDTVRWIDTDVMLADPLTKVMEPWKLNEAIDTNYWSLKQPIESIVKKRAKQLQRRKAKDENAEQAPIEEVVYHAVNTSSRISESEMLMALYRHPDMKVWQRFDYDALCYKATLRGGPKWEDVMYRVTTKISDGTPIAFERVYHDLPYDWHQRMCKNGREDIRTDLYYRDGYSSCTSTAESDDSNGYGIAD